MRDLVSLGRFEPVFGSWSVGRWALSDALAMLIDLNLSSDEIPILLGDLDSLLEEIHAQQR